MAALTQFSITEHSAAYWTVTFNHPPINLVDPDTILELQEIVGRIETAQGLVVVVFDSAHPDFFFARYDLSRAADTPVTPGPTGFPTWIDLTTRLEQTHVVTIASVRGRARGIGNEFCLACDLRFASIERALFGQPEVPAGVIPGGGAIERLTGMVGRARALEIVVGGDDFDAVTAQHYGWINRALPDEELDEFVGNFARRLAGFDPYGVAQAKQLINRAGLPAPDDLLGSQAAFFEAMRRPAVRERGLKARDMARAAGDDFELNLGHYLGRI